MDNRTLLRIGVSPWGSMQPKCLLMPRTYCRAGVELEILSTMIAMLGKKIRIKLVESGQSGCGWYKNGAWTGLAGLLERDEIDMTGNVCDLEPERQTVFGFSHPVWQYPQAYLLKAPEPKFAFNPVRPFQSRVWLAFFVCLLLWTCFMTIRYTLFRPWNGATVRVTLLNLLDYTFGFRDATLTAEKFQWFFWICFFAYLTVIYDSYIRAALLYTFPIVRPFKNGLEFSENLLSRDHVLLDYRNPAELPPCMGRACENFQKAIDQGLYVSSPNSQGRHLLSLLSRDEKLVLPKGKIFLESYLSDFRTDNYRTANGDETFWLFEDESMSGRWSVFLWRKNFTLANRFNRMLMTMGDFKFRIRFRYDSLNGNKPITEQTIKPVVLNEDSLTLNRLNGTFVLYFSGIVLSIFVFILEYAKPIVRKFRSDKKYRI